MSAVGPSDFTLITTDGTSVQLSSFWTHSPVLLIFYPRDNTRVCTAQLCDYRDRLADFTAVGVQVIGINPGAAATHKAFAHVHGLRFPILSDPTRVCCRAFGAAAWWGTRRLSVLLDQHGQEVWRLLGSSFTRPPADVLLDGIKKHLPVVSSPTPTDSAD